MFSFIKRLFNRKPKPAPLPVLWVHQIAALNNGDRMARFYREQGIL